MKNVLALTAVLLITAACAEQVIRIENVPYVTQAPYANWEDPVFHEGCEEAAILMAMGWVEGIATISEEDAYEGIQTLAEFAKNEYGFYLDTSARDTARLIQDYYDYNNIEVKESVTAEDIVNELKNDNLVIVPVNSTILTNPYFTPPGPKNHMIVIFGYDRNTKEFITHEPGTMRGESYRYDQDTLYEALQDYPSGFAEPREEINKVIIVVHPRLDLLDL